MRLTCADRQLDPAEEAGEALPHRDLLWGALPTFAAQRKNSFKSAGAKNSLNFLASSEAWKGRGRDRRGLEAGSASIFRDLSCPLRQVFAEILG